MNDQVINVVWSWLRVFLSAILTYVLAGLAADTTLEWQAILIAGAVAVLPVVINWLNAGDPRYGRGYVEPVKNDPVIVEPDE
jgi:hypothetical protein